MDRPTVELLSSGYWHVRWCANLWFQWPRGRAPMLADGFGWVDDRHLREAASSVAEIEREGEP